MNTKTNKKTLRQSRSERCASNMQTMHPTNLLDYYLIELEEWVQHVIDESEKSGDVCKRDRFIALRTALSC